MLSPLELILFGFAVFRLSHLIMRDECPFELCTRVRLWVHSTDDFDEHSRPVYGRWRGEVVKLTSCIVCLSVWVAVPFAYSSDILVWLAQILALSGIAMLIWKFYVR